MLHFHFYNIRNFLFLETFILIYLYSNIFKLIINFNMDISFLLIIIMVKRRLLMNNQIVLKTLLIHNY